MMFPKIYDNFGEKMLDNFFNMENPFKELEKKMNVNMRMDVHEKDGEYQIDIDLPGFKKEDIIADYKDGYITVKATKTEENEDEKGKSLCKERFYGTTERSFYVGETEDIKAKFEHGVLSLTAKKKEEEVKENRIPIEG